MTRAAPCGPRQRRSNNGHYLQYPVDRAGAIMRWAVEVSSTDGFNIHTAGLILLIIGIVGAVLSLAFWSSWGGVRTRRDDVVVDRRL